MRRLPLVLALAAIASPGCATGSAAIDRGLDLSRLDLAAPSEVPAASEWSELRPVATATPAAHPTTAAPRVGGPWISHVSILGGGRWLDNDWDPLEKELVFGLELDESVAATGNGYELGLLYANDEDGIEATTYDVYGGYRYTFGEATQELHPFMSLGLSASNSELEVSGPVVNDSDDDTVIGAYARAGLLWDVSERVRLGLDYRHFFAGDFEWDIAGVGVEADADYDQVLLSLAFEF